MIIREYCKKAKVAVIRQDRYGNRLSSFITMFNVARTDFPSLTPEDVRVVRYAGDRYAKTMGIEFDAKENVGGYKEIEQLEPTK